MRSFTRGVGEIGELGKELLPRLHAALGDGYRLTLKKSTSQIGSGALPTEELPTVAIAIVHATLKANRIAERFRRADPPIIGRIQDERFLLDLRTIFDAEDLIPKFD